MSLYQLNSFHQALADPTRVCILRLLLARELCVCELVAALELPQYKISRHLAVLKHAGLVRDWREGPWMHYEIAPALPPAWRTALDGLRTAWDECLEVQAALWRLQQLALRQPGTKVDTSCGTCICE